jgi:hypothetical protein
LIHLSQLVLFRDCRKAPDMIDVGMEKNKIVDFAYAQIRKKSGNKSDPPVSTAIGRPDDVKAARQPVLRYRAG